MHTFEIISTIQVGNIIPGDVLIHGDNSESSETEGDAMAYGEDIRNGLSGDRAMNEARDSADVLAVTVW